MKPSTTKESIEINNLKFHQIPSDSFNFSAEKMTNKLVGCLTNHSEQEIHKIGIRYQIIQPVFQPFGASTSIDFYGEKIVPEATVPFWIEMGQHDVKVTIFTEVGTIPRANSSLAVAPLSLE